MKIGIFVFVAVAAALPTSSPLQARVSTLAPNIQCHTTPLDYHAPKLADNGSSHQQDLLPSTTSSTTQPESLVDAIPINIVASLRRPNGDVIVRDTCSARCCQALPKRILIVHNAGHPEATRSNCRRSQRDPMSKTPLRYSAATGLKRASTTKYTD